MKKNPFDITNLEDVPEIEDMSDEEFEEYKKQIRKIFRDYEMFDIKQQEMLDAHRRQGLAYEEQVAKANQIFHILLIHIRDKGPQAEILRLAELTTDEAIKVSFQELALIAQRQRQIYTPKEEV